MAEDKNWDNAPVIFKKDVVEQLNFKDRCSLGKTSNSNKEIVEIVPTNVRNIGFSDAPGPELKLEFQERNGDSSSFFSCLVVHTSAGENMVDDLLRVFDHPKSTVDSFYLIISKTPAEKANELIEEFHTKLMERPESYKIRAKQFNWICKDSKVNVMNVLGKLDLAYLEGMHIDCPVENLQALLDTEQCKKAKKLVIGPSCKFDLPVAQLLDKNVISVCVERITPEEIWETIKNFRSTQRPPKSEFNFFNYTPGNNLFDIPSILSLIDVPVENYVEHAEVRIGHTQLFKMKGRKILEVKITEQGVSGEIGDKQYYNVDRY